MRYSIIGLVMIISGVIILGCDGGSSGSGDSPAAVTLAVTAEPIRTSTVEETVSAIGETAVTDQQTIVSPFDGTVVSIDVQPGETVAKDQKVAVIRTRDSEASIAGAKRLLQDAKTKAQKETAQKALDVAEANQQLVPIITQQKGTVADKMVSAGQTVAQGAELLRLVDLATLDFVADVRLADIGAVKVGQNCRIEFPSLPNEKWTGTIAAIEPQSDITSQAVPVRIGFSRSSTAIDKILRAGMRGIATIVTGVRHNTLTVPEASIIRDDLTGTHHVFIISPDSLAIGVPVSVGARVDSLIEISSPRLKAGMSVIVDGSYEAADSMRVTVTGAP